MMAKALCAAAFMTAMPAMAQADCADLALVLAVDASGSIDAEEFSLQRQGYALAFADPTVRAALQSAGTVDVALVLWGDAEIAPQTFAWQRITTAGQTETLMANLMFAPRQVTGNTGIGRGVSAALDLLEAHCALRRIINVSGDGIESTSPRPRHNIPLVTARARADAMGVTINALAIANEQADLANWYEDHLITGPGAFVMTAASFDDFGAAIIRKLGREIAPPQLAMAMANNGDN